VSTFEEEARRAIDAVRRPRGDAGLLQDLIGRAIISVGRGFVADEINEIRQIVWAALLEKFWEFPTTPTLARQLFSIVKFKTVDFLRARKRALGREVQGLDVATLDQPDACPGPEAAVEYAERVEVLRAALGDLKAKNPRDYDAVLAYGAGLRLEEAFPEKYGALNPEASRQVTHRALQRLRAIVRQEAS
jgi:DNA-directed RNA polymerase specialized sigma24 family protein